MEPREPAVLRADGAVAMSEARAPERPRVNDAPLVYVAGLWRRLLAALVDGAIVLPAAYLLARLAGRLAGVGLPAARNTSVDYWLDLALAGDPALWGFLGLTLTIGLLYLLLFQTMAGRTL